MIPGAGGEVPEGSVRRLQPGGRGEGKEEKGVVSYIYLAGEECAG